jgi:hypothetical protein
MSTNRQPCERPKTRRLWPGFAASVIVLTPAGCSGAPMFNILGSYFPSWLVCVAISIGLTFLAHLLVTAKNLADQLWPLPVVYSALLCLFSCALWLILFR